MFNNLTGDSGLMRLMLAPLQHSVADTERFIRERLAAWDEGIHWTYAITLHGDPAEMIGRIGLKRQRDGISVGYMIARRLGGQGLATEAVKMLAPVALSMAEKLIGICDIENTASARVLEKSGFQLDGLRKQFMVFPNHSNAARDCLMYSHRP